MTNLEKLLELTKTIPLNIYGGHTLPNGTRVTFVAEADLVMLLEHLVGVDKQLDEIDTTIRTKLGFT